jgi:hypothetical protein
MPNVGDIVGSREAGMRHRGRYIWCACPDCGVERWRRLADCGYGVCDACRAKRVGVSNRGRKISDAQKKIISERMSGKRNHGWKGGRHVSKHGGYTLITLEKDHPYRCMARPHGNVLEHRLVMAEYLGRPLEKWEIVHHKDKNRSNNSIDNLEIMSDWNHKGLESLLAEMKRMREIIKEYEDRYGKIV